MVSYPIPIDSDEMEIDPRTNGIHSLAEGLKSFKHLHQNRKDIFACKDSILRTHHALETLFKDILFHVNPVLLVSGDIHVRRIVEEYQKLAEGKNVTILDELWTVSLNDTIETLRKLKIIKLDERDYRILLDSIKKLTNYRNALQHFGLKVDFDVVARILGNTIPRAVDVLESIPYSREGIMDTLQKIMSEAPEIIDMLRNNYDRLIQEAVEFFSGRSFEDAKLNLKIRDFGMVGAGPYVPEINSQGFLNFDFDRMSLINYRFSKLEEISEIEPPYTAKLDITQPKFTEYPNIRHNGSAEGSLKMEAHITFDRAEQALKLIGAEEKITVLRTLTIVIDILLNYRAEAFMTDVHYECEKILQADGHLKVLLSALPRGFESAEGEVLGQYEASLNEQKAPFRLHAFLEPDGSLRKNYYLEWSINTLEALRFSSASRIKPLS